MVTSGKVRSPNYPSLSLREAVAKVEAMYKKEYTNFTPREVAATRLGYGSLNGASASAISALLKYGLLEHGKGREQVRVTQRAVDIILTTLGHPERVAAIQAAAFAPALFAELRNQFGEKLPSDESLRLQLIKRGFNPRYVGEVIHAYRDTIAFVDEEGANPSAPVGDVDDREDEAPMETVRMQEPVSRSQSMSLAPIDEAPGVKTLRFPIGDDLDIQTTFKGNITPEAFEDYIQILRLTLRMPKITEQRTERPVSARTVRPMLEPSYDDAEDAG